MKQIIIILTLLTTSFALNANPLWLRYSAISPNGEQIAFTYQGDIFIVATNGGEAKPITHHIAHDYNPVWSPDGKSLAFASDRHGNFDIFTIPVSGGQPFRVTYNSAKEIPSSFTPDGKEILFTATIADDVNNAQFPYALLSELYSVPTNGGRTTQILTTPAQLAKYNKSKDIILYQDVKGYEDYWRKHHTSAVTRDIWTYDTNTKKHTKITSFNGEDMFPIFKSDEKSIYYLSEENGTFNVWTKGIASTDKKQLTHHDKHPVRFLTSSNNNKMCYSYNGELYTFTEGTEPQKVNITISNELKINNEQFLRLGSGGNGMSVSPSGKEIAFIIRGEVFVSSVEYSTTRRITNTPEQERSVSFSPDGRMLVYASEREGSWNIYTSKIENKDEKYFTSATVITEEPVVVKPAETFLPSFSPDGKEIAFLEERTILKVINLKKKEERVILPGKYNYSYSDGDQSYSWSPDGKWFLVQYSPNTMFVNDIALVDAQGDLNIINLTKSGYDNSGPKWSMGGKAILWTGDKYGYRSHGSWGSERDVFAMFLTKEAFDNFRLSKEELGLKKELDKSKDKSKKDSKSDSDSTKKDSKKKLEEIKIEFEGLEDRVVKLTSNSSFLSDMILTTDGEKLFYLSRFEKGYDLWMKSTRSRETKLVMKLSGSGGNIQFEKAAKNMYLQTGGSFAQISTTTMKRKSISYSAEFNLDKAAERAYMFEHVWRQVKKKFYDPELHGVDWDFYKSEYAKFLPHINNNYDYSEMLSELLGELNGSHTGCRYRGSSSGGDQTATFGAFFDNNYTGEGLKIVEIMDNSPLAVVKAGIKEGMIIEKIDGNIITSTNDYYKYLNHKSGKNLLITVLDPKKKKSKDVIIKPISASSESGMLYKRWVKMRRAETEKLSGGKVGYVHVKGMDSNSFRDIYSETLGRNYNKESLIVDTRFNGGGWLHDDLATFLSGTKYADFAPRGQMYGSEPINKWTKPSAVLISEGNYSDAYGFPYAYMTLKIGKLIGMPVPGTMTAVWWETLQDKSLVFGIPQVGMKNMDGKYLENMQIEPDVKVSQDYDVVIKGKDQQLEKAVETLLNNK